MVTAALASILPDACAVMEARNDILGAFLLPEEAEALGEVAPARLREFTTGRMCARRALEALNYPAAPILRGTHREPLWPPGIVGSITHCRGYCGAAVARRAHLSALGIDAEPHEELSRAVLKHVAFGEELDWLRGHHDPTVCWDRVLFCAKESVYKAWFQLTERWLGFEDVTVTMIPEEGKFLARLKRHAAIAQRRVCTEFTGRVIVDTGIILTAVVVSRRTDIAGRAPARR